MNKRLVAGFMLVFVVGLVMALELPPDPMYFYGTVSYTDGTAIPNGYYLSAKSGSTISGECEIIDSKYGWGKNVCIVVKPENSQSKIEFFLGNLKLGEYTFKEKEFVNLNFTTDSLPENFTPLSNGICESAKGECSYNLVDCDASKTDVCAGNGRCDAEIGETCSFTPQDCGQCSSSSSSSSGGGGSSSGGGGGSSSGGGKKNSNNTTLLITNNTNNTNTGTIDLTVDNENYTDTNGQGNARITGGVIGFVSSGSGIGMIIAVLVIIVGLGVVIVSGRKQNVNAVSTIKPKSPENVKK